jgi:peptide/nickel transport system ATP-binding protein
MTTAAAVTLVANELDFSYGNDKSQVLHSIDLEIAPGERVGVVGESGSGKTTLAKLLVGVLQSDQVSVNGKPWSQWPRHSEPRRAVQLVQQDPFASLTPHLSARSTVAEAARVTGQAKRREAEARATALLDSVGIGERVAVRRPSALSGGQCQRVSIARALAAGPSVLFADEPTSALDLSVQAQIVNLLLSLTKERGLGLVLVSHDMAVIRHVTERVLVMRDGRVVEQGPTSEVLGSPRHEYTRMLCEADLWQRAA